MTLVRREPKMRPEIGTPCGSSQLGDTEGHCDAGTVKRELGWAAGVPGFQGWPCQSRRPAGASGVRPSHHGSPDGYLPCHYLASLGNASFAGIAADAATVATWGYQLYGGRILPATVTTAMLTQPAQENLAPGVGVRPRRSGL